jgi:pimeloyl-ACP methyl ester carboxylesterase
MLAETERELFQLRTDPEVLNLLRVGRPNSLDDWVTRTLRAVGCSVLIARGAYSGVLSTSSARNLAARLRKKGSGRDVPAAGHNIPLDQPEYLGRLMSSFVEDIKASCQI